MDQYFVLMIAGALDGFALLCLYPLWRIFSRAGLSPWWSLLVLIPGLGFWLVGGLLAFKPWPNGLAGGGGEAQS